MRRTRVNGHKFEEELDSAVEKAPFPAYLIRLRTPQLQQAGVRNIADFIVFGLRAVILEVKETGEKSFSLNTFQQHDEVAKFKEFFEEAKTRYPWGFACNELDYPYRIAILVHFIKEGKYTLYYMDDNPFKVIHSTDDDCITKDSLEEILRYIFTESFEI